MNVFCAYEKYRKSKIGDPYMLAATALNNVYLYGAYAYDVPNFRVECFL